MRRDELEREMEEMNREALSSAKMLAWTMVTAITVVVGVILFLIYYSINH
jgi:uncharacterized membrane protein